MNKIAIHDANILIDLIQIDIFSYTLKLDFHFYTTSLIVSELNDSQASTVYDFSFNGKIDIIPVSALELQNIFDLTTAHKRLSEQDCSAIYFAKEFDALLLTGDKHLRKVAETSRIEVRGILWILDQLVENELIDKDHACRVIKELMQQNKRIPIVDCQQRMEKWCY